MGGRIWVESEPGRGSMFHFTAHFQLQPNPSRQHEPANLESLRDLPVLIVDDNATNRRILEETLLRWGMNPASATGGQEALAILERSDGEKPAFALVLLDVHMPDLDGFGVAAAMRRNPRLADCPIVMLTSAGGRSDAARCRELRIAGYLPKPLHSKDLLRAILAALGTQARRRKPRAERSSLAAGEPQELKILLVEDNPVNQLLASRILQKRGHVVVLAGDGKSAVEIVRQQSFDLVLMDVQMPEMDGLEATTAIREHERASGKHVPIIAMTAHALVGDKERCLEAGMDGYLSKPMQPEELYAILDDFSPPAPSALSPHNSASAIAAPIN